MRVALDMTKVNDLQVESIRQLVRTCKAAHMVDVRMRINGEWVSVEADWIKHLTITAETPNKK